MSLSERLIDAVVEALPYDPSDGTMPTWRGPHADDSPLWLPVEKVAATVATAMLRGLADSGWPTASTLRALADEIEAAE